MQGILEKRQCCCRVFFSHSLDFSPHTLYNIRCMRMLVYRNPYPVKKHLSAGDIGMMVAVIALALILFLLPTNEVGQVCVITWDGGETTLPLSEPTTFTVESRGHTLTVVIENGTVRVVETTCPDAICMAAGEISHGGEMLVCVPAGVVIRIPGEISTGEDYIVG